MVMKGLTYTMIASIFVKFFILLMNGNHDLKDQSDDLKIKHALLCLIPLGFGSLIGPLVTGYIQDKFGFIFAIIYIGISMLIMGFILLIENERAVFNKTNIYIASFFMGVVDNSWKVTTAGMIG